MSLFQWMGTEEFEMQQIELNTSSLRAYKFTQIQIHTHTNTENCQHRSRGLYGIANLPSRKTCQRSFYCLKEVAFALICAFGSTYVRTDILTFESLRPLRVMCPTESF